MPTLKDMRSWLRGNKVESLPSRDTWDGRGEAIGLDPDGPIVPRDDFEVVKDDEPDIDPRSGKKLKGGIDPEAMRKRSKARRAPKDRRFNLTTDGRDAVLRFGTHRDSRVSELAESEEGRDYLEWMTRAGKGGLKGEPFPEAITEVIRAHLRHKEESFDPDDYGDGDDDDEDFDSERGSHKKKVRPIKGILEVYLEDESEEWLPKTPPKKKARKDEDYDDDLPFSFLQRGVFK